MNEISTNWRPLEYLHIQTPHCGIMQQMSMWDIKYLTIRAERKICCLCPLTSIVAHTWLQWLGSEFQSRAATRTGFKGYVSSHKVYCKRVRPWKHSIKAHRIQTSHYLNKPSWQDEPCCSWPWRELSAYVQWSTNKNKMESLHLFWHLCSNNHHFDAYKLSWSRVCVTETSKTRF